MPIVVSSSVDKVMFNKKCDLTAKFYIMKAESEDMVEEKLVFYNLALAFSKSEEIRIEVYKKRVNIYAELKFYQQCSENEHWIFEILQDDKIPMFKKRNKLADCMGSKFEGHVGLPNILNSVICSPENKLMTKKHLKAGQLIAREEPFCGVLLESAIYRRCKNCLKCNNLNLIPCLKCQLAMFCSTTCLKEARFHFYECECDQISKIPFNFGGIQVALRSCFELLVNFEGSVEQMMNFVDHCKKNPQSFFNQMDGKCSKHAAMLSLKHFSPLDCHDDLIEIIQGVLNIYPKICELFATEQQKDFLIDFLIMQSTLDFIVHYDYKLQVPTALSVNFMYNAMDHSCSSNVHAVFDDGRLHYYLKYPIEKGEILTYNHILNFEISAYDIRKLTAKTCYNFECKCTACIQKYPLLYSMHIFNQQVFQNAMEQKENIPKMKKKDLKRAFKENCKYIDANYENNFPSQELYILHLCNTLILSKLIS